MKIKGIRCDLRTLKKTDAYDLAELVRNNKYYWSQFEPLHREEFYTAKTQHQKIIDSLALQQAKREFSFGIFDKKTQRLIGNISLYAIKRLPYSSAFVGYSIDKEFIGQGIATEALQLILNFAFTDVNIHRVEAYVAPGNLPSVRVLEKAGFTQEGLLRKLLFINGEWVDHFMYALLKEDYTKKVERGS